MQLTRKFAKHLKDHLKTAYFAIAILTILITACAVEGKMAQYQIRNSKFKAVIIGPEYIRKISLKSDSLTREDSLRFKNIDSLLYYQSEIIQYLEDSIFLKYCLISMQNELILNYNVKLYRSNSAYEALPDSTFILKFADMEMEEFKQNELAVLDGPYGPYNKRVFVDAINVNTWFELEYKTPSVEKFPILYTSFYHSNDVVLELDTLNAKIEIDSLLTYQSMIDSLHVENLINTYKSAKELGKRYASYFYDYMLNVKLYDAMPEDRKPEFYFHYNYKTGRVYPIYDEMFIELEQ